MESIFFGDLGITAKRLSSDIFNQTICSAKGGVTQYNCDMFILIGAPYAVYGYSKSFIIRDQFKSVDQ